jgi:hypothetical protein
MQPLAIRATPDVVADTVCHRRRHAQCLLATAEIVEGKPQHERCAVIPKLLAEAVGQAGNATGAHSHREVSALMTSCNYSFHDLSRVQLDRAAPRTPRFNMPFELGLLLGWQKVQSKSNHTWFVFESERRRLQKSLSDLDGTDPLIHHETIRGVFGELSNALVKSRYRPDLSHMNTIYRHIRAASSLILRRVGANSLFGARVFQNLVVLATDYAERTIPRR